MIGHSTLPAGVAWTGWGSLFMGALMDFSALMFVAAQALLGNEQLDALAGAGGLSDSAITLLHHAGGVAVAQGCTGTLLIVTGVYFLRRRRWALVVIEVSSWLAIVYTLVAGPFLLRSVLGSGILASTSALVPVAAMGAAVIVLQVVLLGYFIRFLRRPNIRSVFNSGRQSHEPA